MIRCLDRTDILTRACELAPLDGLVLEFGVASGTTIRLIAEALAPRKVYGFDSFRGLPEPWASYETGHFACAPPAVPDNVELVIGLFAETLPAFLTIHAGNAALIHLDCDLYSSTRTVLEALTPRMTSGTVIALDEYWILPEHEQRAFEEWVASSQLRCRDDCRTDEQLLVVME